MSRDIDPREVGEREEKPKPRSRMTMSQGRGGASGEQANEKKPLAFDLADLRERIDRAAKDSPSLEEFFDRLAAEEIRPLPSVQSNGRWNGISYEFASVQVKGAELGRAYTAQGLQQRKSVRYEASRDLERLRGAASAQSARERTVVRRHPERESHDLSSAQKQVLWEAGRFRTVAVPELARVHYDGKLRNLERDLKNLIAAGLAERHTVALNGNGKSISVVALTRQGKRLLKATERSDQALYSGLVKPRELEHDAAIYRMYLAESERIEGEGGRVTRVVLDYELKKRAYSPLAKAHDLSALAYAERQQEIARENGLEVVDGRLVLPDLRVEYETREGEERSIDLELATRNYRAAHIRAKASAGFKVYADTRSGRLAAVLDNHDLVAELLRS
ncbi:MAG: hypothetical protein SFV18_16200 [Bryobacteraceae bacterium]|nr:hypothetical protein [Bryobacteraceae bacterium]